MPEPLGENRNRSRLPYRSPKLIKKLILERLEEGEKNKNSLSIGTHTEWPKLVRLLEELIATDCVGEIGADHVKMGPSFFRITPNGRAILQKLDELSRNPGLRQFLPFHPGQGKGQ